jgi:hypothetical protein
MYQPLAGIDPSPASLLRSGSRHDLDPVRGLHKGESSLSRISP